MLGSIANYSFAFGCVLIAHVAQAATAVESMGTATCGQYGQAYKTSPKNADAVFMSWVQGFLSGWNVGALYRKEPLRDLSGKSVDEQVRFIQMFCANNPLLPVFQGAVELYKSLPEAPAPAK